MPISAQTFGYYRPRFTLAQMRAIIAACHDSDDYGDLPLEHEPHVQSALKQLKDMVKEND